MKKSAKIIVALFLLSLNITAYGQFLGLRASNFGGVNNVNYNPAIADNKYKLDINVFITDFTAANNYVALSGKPFNYNNFDSETRVTEKLTGKRKFGYISSTTQLPLSFLLTFGKDKKNNQAIAVTSHINAVISVDNLHEPLARNIRWGWGTDAFNRIGDFTGVNNSVKNMGIKSMMWADLGITYSRVIIDKEKHFLKAGATIKLIKGLAAGYAYSKTFNYNFPNLDTFQITNTEVKAGTTKNLDYYTDNGAYEANSFFTKDMLNNSISKWTVAGDFAVVYEFRKNKEEHKYTMDCKDYYSSEKDKHFIQVGLSVINLGRIAFRKSDNVYDYNITEFTTTEKFDQNTLFTTWLNGGTKDANNSSIFKMWLPTTINAWADFNLYKGMGVNVAAQINPIPQRKNNVHHLSIVSVTPKYEHKWVGAYMPIAVDQLANVQWGLGLRLGPVYIASQDIFTYMIKKNKTHLNIQFGIRASIGNKPRDRDKDGVSNKFDDCKKLQGNCLSKGCPDIDGDGVMDNIDKCPEVAGLAELQGCPDADGDSIPDNEDDCPSKPGLKIFNGCPDTDSDGIIDKFDKCPKERGPKETKGCPDADGDGVPDAEDACPFLKGDKENQGCPDTDGDGIYDHMDQCVKDAGPIENGGCPYKDTDSDGIFDKDDACPDRPGILQFKGCPDLDENDKKLLERATRIQFETGKSVIKPSAKPVLNDVSFLLKKYDFFSLIVEGHADITGSAERNLALSKERAKATMDYLISKGIEETRITSEGYGIDRPIADNKTEQGRAKNRRVEFILYVK